MTRSSSNKKALQSYPSYLAIVPISENELFYSF